MDPTTQLLPFPLPSLTPFHRLICFLWAMVSASLHPNIFAGWRSVAEVSTYSSYRLFEAQGKDTVPRLLRPTSDPKNAPLENVLNLPILLWANRSLTVKDRALMRL
jgi:hypothetical protein